IYVTAEGVRNAYARNKDLFAVTKSKVGVEILKETARAKRAHSHTAQRNKYIVDALNQQDDLMAQMQDLVAALPKHKPIKRSKPMTGKPSV
ncbi:hypothetical protein, partial [Pseudoalteromonas distincta]|uniref:hypothetical protein n=1 Tax=Pseudoalteromonas distincta TaxID=77608 RepID=UPI0034E89D45